MFIGFGLPITQIYGSGGPLIVIGGLSVSEDATVGTLIGTLSVVNGDGVYTFSITADPDSKFALDGDDLETSAALDFETATSHSVTIEADNGVDTPLSKTFIVQVTNVFEAASLSALSLDTDDIDENSAEDTVVGAVVGKTTGSTLSLIDTAGGRFKLTGTDIVAGAVSTDYETATTHNITIRETLADSANSPRDTVIPITINDVDEIAPILSNVIDTATGATTASLSVDTDEGNGTLYWVVTSSATSPTSAQVAAGNDHTGSAAVDSGSQSVAATGTQSVSGGATGLTAETTDFAHFMHADAIGNQSAVLTAGGFTTEVAPESGALDLLGSDDGLALDFTDDAYFASKGFYGSAAVVGGGTRDGYDDPPTTAADSLLTYTAPSLKLTHGSDGLLRYQAHNLLVQSENFATTWAKLTAGDVITADTFTPDATGAAHIVRQPAAGGFVVGARYSIRAEFQGGAGYSHALISTNDATTTRCWVNLDTGALGTTTAGVFNAQVENMGSGWYAVSFDFDPSASGSQIQLSASPSNGNTFFTGNGVDFIKVRKAHLRRTPSDDTYLATTTTARFDLPYQWSPDGTTLEGLLVEEARTNACFPSQSLQAASWVAIAGSIAASAETAPDGTLKATQYTSSVGSARNTIYRQVAITAGTNQVHSYFVKAGTGSFVCITLNSGAGNNHVVGIFDLSNSANTTATQTAVGSGGGTLVSTFQEALPGGWFRIGLIGHTSSSAPFTQIGFAAAATGNTIGINGDVSNAANGQTFHIWGADSQLGSFPTSHIQTFAATVTRAADNISLAASATPITAVPFTAMAEVRYPNDAAGFPCPIWLGDSAGPVAQRAQMYHSASGVNYACTVRVNSTAGTFNTSLTGTITPNVVSRVALAFATGSSNGSVNGGAVLSDITTAINPTINTIWTSQANSGHLNGLIRKLVIVPTRKTNAELVTLSTP